LRMQPCIDWPATSTIPQRAADIAIVLSFTTTKSFRRNRFTTVDNNSCWTGIGRCRSQRWGRDGNRIASGELNTAVINSITASMPPWASSSLMVSRSDSADRKDTNVAEAKTFRPNTSLSQTNRCADWEQAVNAPHCSRPERTNVVDEMGTQS
ncbi:hypothetical protein T09_6338, partial [Trichinella sp. T9]